MVGSNGNRLQFEGRFLSTRPRSAQNSAWGLRYGSVLGSSVSTKRRRNRSRNATEVGLAREHLQCWLLALRVVTMDRRYDDSPAATGSAVDYPIPHVSPLYVIVS